MSQIESPKPATFIGKDGKPVTAVALSEATAEQIARWKEQHGKVYKITVDGKVCYLKRPSRKVLSYATAAGKDDPLKFNEAVLRECWLGGDEVIKTDDALFMGVGARLADIIEIKQAELEEL